MTGLRAPKIRAPAVADVSTSGFPWDHRVLGPRLNLFNESGWLPTGEELLQRLTTLVQSLYEARGFSAQPGAVRSYGLGPGTSPRRPYGALCGRHTADAFVIACDPRDLEHEVAGLAAAFADLATACELTLSRVEVVGTGSVAAGLARALTVLGSVRITRGTGVRATLHLGDALGRSWPVGRIVVDRSGGESGSGSHADVPPTMKLHGSLTGSIELLSVLLLERSRGGLPWWLAPEQVRVLPVSQRSLPYAQEVSAALAATGLRTLTNERAAGPLAGRVRDAARSRLPCIGVVGRREARERAVSVREADSTRLMPLTEFVRWASTHLYPDLVRVADQPQRGG